MSKLTESILCSIDYEVVKQLRIENYISLHKHLKESNKFSFELGNNDVPMVYPYWINNGIELKGKLISNKIFVATYWPNVFEWTKEEYLEYKLAKQILPLPIDQRYGRIEIEKIKNNINI